MLSLPPTQGAASWKLDDRRYRILNCSMTSCARETLTDGKSVATGYIIIVYQVVVPETVPTSSLASDPQPIF